MGLIRIIVIGLIIYLLFHIIKRWMANKNSAPSKLEEKQMVQCKVCQLHIPEEEALQKDGQFFCSQEHLEDNSN